MISKSSLAFVHLSVDLTQIFVGAWATLALQLLKWHVLLLELHIIGTSRLGSFLDALSISSSLAPQNGAIITLVGITSDCGLLSLFGSTLTGSSISLCCHIIRSSVSYRPYIQNFLRPQQVINLELTTRLLERLNSLDGPVYFILFDSRLQLLADLGRLFPLLVVISHWFILLTRYIHWFILDLIIHILAFLMFSNIVLKFNL